MEDVAKYKIAIMLGGLLACVIMVLTYFFITKGVTVSFFRTRPNFEISTKGVRKVTLDNGMTLLILKNPSVPKVLIQIAYNIGSYVEEAGERGLAHLIEHMIFKGTERLSESDIDQISRKYGATFNAFTSVDVTSYYFEANKNNWQPFVEVLADCMQNARFEQQHLASEVKAVIQELKMYRDNYWSMMFEKMNMTLFPANHPYHYPIIGFKQDLMNLSADNLKKFYKKYYTPDRATLFVVGDVEDEEVIALVKKHFDSIKSDHKASVHEFPRISDDLMTHHTRLFENVTNEQLGFYWRIPGEKDKNEVISSAASLLLGGGEGSRLYRTLVDEKKIASSVGTYPQKSMQEGLFLILIEPMEGKRQACKQAVAEELEKAIKNGFTEKELEHMTRVEGKRFFQRLQNYKNFTYEWLTSYFATGDEYAIFHQVNKFVDIQSDQIQTFIKEYLNPLLMNQIEVIPLPESMKAESEARKKASDALDEEILSKYVRTVPVEPVKSAPLFPPALPLEFSFPKPDLVLTIDNGLKIILKQNNTLPIIQIACKFKNSFHNTHAREGILLDLTMDMLIEGSEGFSKKDNVDFFEFYGASYYFYSEGVTLSMLSADYKVLLERLMHVLLKPTFPAESFDKVKHISIDSFQRSKDDSSEIGIRELKDIIYKNHPYGWNFDEAIDLVKKASINDIKQLHNKHVTPSNMVLTVVGDFDLNHMASTLKSLCGSWPKGSKQEISYPALSFEPGFKKDIHLVRDQVVMLFGMPSSLTIYDEDIIPMKLLNYITFYSLGSRIYSLRERTGLFYNAFGGWAAGAGKEVGINYVGAILNPDKVDYAEREMLRLIDELGAQGVSEDELKAAQQMYLKSLIDSMSTNGAIAELLCMLDSFELGFDYYDKVLSRIQTLPLEHINQIAKKYFNTKDFARVRVGRVK